MHSHTLTATHCTTPQKTFSTESRPEDELKRKNRRRRRTKEEERANFAVVSVLTYNMHMLYSYHS